MKRRPTTLKLIDRQAYLAQSDVRPAAITVKLDARDADAYVFAARANRPLRTSTMTVGT